MCKLSDFDDDAYDYDDGTEIVTFRCRSCYTFTDREVRSGNLTDDKCDHCGSRL